MKRILVVGHRGMLGTDLMKRLGAEKGSDPLQPSGGLTPFLPVGADLPELDITDRDAVMHAFEDLRPHVAINCAAWTDVDGAESRRAEAMRVNDAGAGNVAAAAHAVGARVVHLSTDFVFDGTKAGAYVEDDPPHPLSVYGESKLAGERAVAGAARDHLIVRTSWLYGAAGRNFVTTIRRLAAERDELQVVDDQRGCPTWTRDLAEAIVALVSTGTSTALGAGARGIVHASGSGACSWYEFACEIVKRSGLATPVKPITSAAMRRPARRPANSVLDCSRLAQLTGFRFPHWRESLAAFLAGLDRGDDA